MWPFNRLKVFWKVFIWFWLSLILLVLVFLTSWALVKDSISYYSADREMVGISKKLAKLLESDMLERRKLRFARNLLRPYEPSRFKRIPPEKDQFRPFYLVDEQLKDWKGEKLPVPVVGLLAQPEVAGRVAVYGDFIYIGGPKITIENVSYQLIVTQFIGRYKGRVIFHILHSISIWQALIFLATSAAMCFLLAWTITRPIRLLQQSANQLASGDNIKASESMGNRRDEFFELAQDFDQMAEKILATVSAQKQMLSDVSHELRSPLTRMQIALGLIEKQLNHDDIKHLKQVVKDCELMEQMIAQLLKLASLERGQLYEAEQRFNLNELLEQLMKDVSYEANQRNIKLNVNYHISTNDIELNGYYGLLRSAVENCLRNAIKYAPDDSLVEVFTQQEQGFLKILICDQGSGVKDENLDKLFDPFFRTDDARARESGGTGLGLAIARRAILAHGGDICAQNRSAPDSGLCMVLRLPMERILSE